MSVTPPAQVGWKGLPSYVLDECGIAVDHDWFVTIPYRFPDGSLYSARVVAPGGRRWWRPGDGRPVIPYGLDRLEQPRFRKYRVLVITEGESDSLAVWGTCGYEGIDVLGVPGAGMWKARWRTYIAGYHAIYVAGDGDEAGRRMTSKVLADVPTAAAVWLPDGDDVRSLIQRDGADAFLALLDEADLFAAAFGSEKSVARAA